MPHILSYSYLLYKYKRINIRVHPIPSSPHQETQQRIRYQVMLNATSGVSGCIIPELEAQETLTINVCFDPQGGMIFLILG